MSDVVHREQSFKNGVNLDGLIHAFYTGVRRWVSEHAGDVES
jgi:hypothetical protein